MYEIYFICGCPHHFQTDVDAKFFNKNNYCPGCGRHKDTFRREVKRWVSTSQFWWPPSWKSGFWEYSDGSSLGVEG